MITPEILTLKIFSCKDHQTFEVEWVELEAPNGSFTLCPGHHDLVSQLKTNGNITFKNPSGTISTLSISGGVATIQNGDKVFITIFNNSN